jgi:hypothetical protein
MLSSSIPAKFGLTFASGAVAPTFLTPQIPDAPQTNGHASMTDGFPPLNFQQIAAGGIPPWGADMNGLMKQVSAWLQWQAAGNAGIFYDAAFSTKIGGYPKGAFLQKLSTQDRYWISTADNNTANPDTGGANWIPFPDVIVQQQAGNYKIDVGTPNAFDITLSPLPANLASIVGAPIRVRAANANTSASCTINIRNAAGDPAVPMINGNGSPLLVGQIARPNQIFEGFLDGLGNFQLAWPPPLISTPAQQLWAPGQIIIWPTQIAPLGTLECNGASVLISSYPNLYNVIGGQYGSVDANHFNLPDLRGMFLRGWDHGRGIDVNSSARTNRGDGTTGDHTGTVEAASINGSQLNAQMQFDIQQWHTTFAGFGGGGGWMTPDMLAMIFSPVPPVPSSGLMAITNIEAGFIGGKPGYGVDGFIANLNLPNTGETRPININVMYVIAY